MQFSQRVTNDGAAALAALGFVQESRLYAEPSDNALRVTAAICLAAAVGDHDTVRLLTHRPDATVYAATNASSFKDRDVLTQHAYYQRLDADYFTKTLWPRLGKLISPEQASWPARTAAENKLSRKAVVVLYAEATCAWLATYMRDVGDIELVRDVAEPRTLMARGAQFLLALAFATPWTVHDHVRAPAVTARTLTSFR